MMSLLLHTIRWDLIRQFRYNILTAAILIMVIYVALILGLSFPGKEKLVVFLIFNDPAAIGMLFIGSLVLFERSDRTLEALQVTPLPNWQYLLSKVLTLTFIAWACSLPMALAGHGWSVDLFYFTLGIVLPSVFFTSIGFIVVLYSQSFNAYILKVGLLLIPAVLPFLNFFGLMDTLWWYIVPVQGALILLEASLGKVFPVWEIVYSIGYLSVASAVAFWWALRIFERKTN